MIGWGRLITDAGLIVLVVVLTGTMMGRMASGDA